MGQITNGQILWVVIAASAVLAFRMRAQIAEFAGVAIDRNPNSLARGARVTITPHGKPATIETHTLSASTQAAVLKALGLETDDTARLRLSIFGLPPNQRPPMLVMFMHFQARTIDDNTTNPTE